MWVTTLSTSLSEINGPCTRVTIPPSVRNNISPFPSNCSAPISFNIVLLSIFDATLKEILVGKFAFIIPVTISTEGLWVAKTT